MNHPELSKPIGLFDSGIGGITVLKALMTEFPNESFIYLGDTARLPYGSKSPETINQYSKQNLAFLKKWNVKAYVIACNSASSHFTAPEFDDTPVFNVIEPGAFSALQRTRNQKIGVLGTRATISSGSYDRALRRLNPHVQIYTQACPLFVPLAEEALIDDPITDLVAQRYLNPLIQEGVDTIILGCTHYPILKSTLQKWAPREIEWVDSGSALADWIRRDFKYLKTDEPRDRAHSVENSLGPQIFISDSSEQFKKLAESILSPLKLGAFEVVNTNNLEPG